MNEERNDPCDGYYAPTAYDSRRDGLPPDPRTSEGGDTILGRSMRKYALSGRGIQCREYLANADLRVFRLFEMEDEPDVRKQLERQGNTLRWRPLKNPAMAMEIFAGVMQVFFILSIPVLIFFVIRSLVSGNVTSVFGGAGLTLALYVSYKLARLALRRGWVKDKNNTVFDRRTGMMTLTWKGKRHAIPFVELEAGTRHIVNHPGIVRYHLFLYHRPTGMFAQHPAGNEHPWQVEVEWEYMQHFMDISRPLPDIPMFEPFRHKDPVTAEHDRRSGRYENYWRDMDVEKAEEMKKKSVEAAKTFLWGKTREEAMMWGWQPSGFGEGEADKGKPGTGDNESRSTPAVAAGS